MRCRQSQPSYSLQVLRAPPEHTKHVPASFLYQMMCSGAIHDSLQRKEQNNGLSQTCIGRSLQRRGEGCAFGYYFVRARIRKKITTKDYYETPVSQGSHTERLKSRKTK